MFAPLERLLNKAIFHWFFVVRFFKIYKHFAQVTLTPYVLVLLVFKCNPKGVFLTSKL